MPSGPSIPTAPVCGALLQALRSCTHYVSVMISSLSVVFDNVDAVMLSGYGSHEGILTHQVRQVLVLTGLALHDPAADRPRNAIDTSRRAAGSSGLPHR